MREADNPSEACPQLLHTLVKQRRRMESGYTLPQELCYSLSIPEGIVIPAVIRVLSAL